MNKWKFKAGKNLDKSCMYVAAFSSSKLISMTQQF